MQMNCIFFAALNIRVLFSKKLAKKSTLGRRGTRYNLACCYKVHIAQIVTEWQPVYSVETPQRSMLCPTIVHVHKFIFRLSSCTKYVTGAICLSKPILTISAVTLMNINMPWLHMIPYLSRTQVQFG